LLKIPTKILTNQYQYMITIPIPAKLPVSKWYTTLPRKEWWGASRAGGGTRRQKTDGKLKLGE
jgi:hypothetical protein